MKMVVWTVLALAVGLIAVGCQGESADRLADNAQVTQGDPDEPLTTSGEREGTSGGDTEQEREVITIEPNGSGYGQCDPHPRGRPSYTAPDGRFVAWTPEGSHILFDDGSRVMKVDAEGTQVDTVVDANPGYRFSFGFHADLSPDGDRIVYSSCEYPLGEVEASAHAERDKYHYEIATVAVDGSAPQRLTDSRDVDHYPVWSPDMTHIAFLSGGGPVRNADTLSIMRADGTQQRNGLLFEYEAAAFPPLWSPDGQRIAFFRYDPAEWRQQWPARIPWVLYTVRLNGTGLTGISEHTGAAAWSPDGFRIAVARVEGEEVVLSTIAPDGSDPRRIIKITDRETSFAAYDESGRFESGGFGYALGPVAWSPDGTHILYVCEAGVCVADLEGNLVGQSPADLIPEGGRPYAAWSPDGSRIAVRSPGLPFDFSYPNTNPHANGAAAVFTMAPDGTDVQVLVRGGPPGGPLLVAENAP